MLSFNTFLTKQYQLSCFPRVKYFGLPISLTWPVDRLVGLVVKASASRAEGPGFKSSLRQDFFGVESYK